MSYTNNSNEHVTTSSGASIPEGHPHPQQAPSRPTSTEHDHLSSARRLAASSQIISLGDKNPSTAPENATTQGAVPEQPTISSSGNALIHDSQDGTQTHQGSTLRIFVTDDNAESMICCNGSVDGSIQDGRPPGPPDSPTTHNRYSYSLQCIFTSTAYPFYPEASDTRPSQMQRELDSFDRCFPS